MTGIMLSCSCGGPFGLALKSAGYDGLPITGRAPFPAVLSVASDGVALTPAVALWGMEIEAAQPALRPQRLDGVVVIGPAGEKRVRFANAASGHRFLGRGGLGAVMGAKRLKAKEQDLINLRVRRLQREAGKSFVSRTTVFRPAAPDKPIAALGCVLMNPMTDMAVLCEILDGQLVICHTITLPPDRNAFPQRQKS